MGNREREEMTHETHSQKRWSHLAIIKGFVSSHHLVNIQLQAGNSGIYKVPDYYKINTPQERGGNLHDFGMKEASTTCALCTVFIPTFVPS